MIFTIIIYSRDHGSNSYVEFQLGLQNSINTLMSVLYVRYSLHLKIQKEEVLPQET